MQLRNPINLGLARWGLWPYKEMDVTKEIGGNLVSKHYIKPECGE